MTVNPEIILTVAAAIFVVAAIVVARLAYRYGCGRRAGPCVRQPAGDAAHKDCQPAGEPVQPVPPPANSAEWIETEAVIINSLQGRITVSVVAQPDRE